MIASALTIGAPGGATALLVGDNLSQLRLPVLVGFQRISGMDARRLRGKSPKRSGTQDTLMKTPLTIILMLGALIGALAFTYSMQAEPAPTNLVCAEKRVVEFGWTNDSQALAEMAAIMRWQETMAEKNPDLAEWHLAQDRALSCRQLPDSEQIQCSISGLPCRYADNKAAE